MALQHGGRHAGSVLAGGLKETQASIADSCSAVLLRLGPRAVDGLVASLDVPDDGVRRRCFDLLGRIGGLRAGDALARLVREDPRLRTSAASSLSDLGPAALPVLLELLLDQDRDVRDAVLVPIGTLGREDDRVVGALIDQLERSAEEIDRAYVALALGHVGPTAMSACPPLVNAFPILTTTSDVDYTLGSPASGGIVDYRVERVVLDGSHPHTRLAFSRELESYGDYFTFTSVDGVSSTYYQSMSGVSQRTCVSVVAKVSTRLFAGGWALAKTSGVDLGLEPDKWREWLRTQ